MRHRLLWGALMTVPVLLLAMGADLPFVRAIPPLANRWMQCVWSLPVVVWAGIPLWQGFWRSLVTRSPGMFTLIGLGVGVAAGFSTAVLLFPQLVPHEFQHGGGVPVYFESAAVITVLVLLGQLLEARATAATGTAIRALLRLVPNNALLVGEEGDKEVPLDEVRPGQHLRIKPGARVPVDGIVTEGHSAVDESMLTGEPMPQPKEKGARLTAGTVNGQGGLVMRAEKVGSETLLHHIIQMVRHAQASKAPVQRLADRVSAWFVPAVVLIAAVTFLLWWRFGPQPALAYAVVNAVSVLIIACPCALGLATPMALTVGLGRGAQKGILVRDAVALELLEQVDTVMLDKTGTLTEGRPTVAEIIPLPGYNARDVLACAAAVESASEHPLAGAIVRAAQERGVPVAPVTEFQAVPGGGVLALVGGQEVFVGQHAYLEKHGVKMQADFSSQSKRLQDSGHTVVIVVLDERPLGLIALKDKIKATTPTAVAALHKLGLRLCMLTGDNQATAQRVGSQLEIDEITAEVTPQEKLKHVQQARQQGRRIAFAGDGINDAPALAAADVGMAMGTGTDVAMESAAITLVKGDLHGIHHAIALSRATMRTIRQNLWFAFLYNGLGIPVAAGLLYPLFGILLDPMLAGAAMSLSSVSVILNSLRLRRA